MKTKRFVSTLLALLLVCSLPVSAFAMDNNPVGGQVSVPASETMGTNSGTVTTNNGTVTNNNGTVTTNNGTVQTSDDGGIVKTNNGTVGNNFIGGTVETNSSTGTVTINYGTVTTNNGTVEHNPGTVETNNNYIYGNNGIVETNNGTVEHNPGTVETNNGIVKINSGTVETNTTTGTVINDENGKVTTNYGTVIDKNGKTTYGVLVDNDGTDIGQQDCTLNDVLDFSKLTKEGYVYAGYTQEYQLLNGVLTKQALTVSDTSYTVTCPNVLTLIWQAIFSPAADDGTGSFGPGSFVSINGHQYLLVAVVEDVYCLASVERFEEEQLSDLPALLASLLTEEQLTHVTGEAELLDEELTARFFAGEGSHIVFPCDRSLIFS